MYRKAIIFGIKGTQLTSNERHLLKNEKPWGIILFSRNIKDIFQLKHLIHDIKNSIKDKNYPILIDQEGGKVSRLNKIIDSSLFSQDYFAKLYKQDKKFFLKNKLIHQEKLLLEFVQHNKYFQFELDIVLLQYLQLLIFLYLVVVDYVI